MNAVRLLVRYYGVSVRSQMQYKVSFLFLTLGHGLAVGIEFLGMWALFDRFGSLRGWTLPEAALFFGLINITFAFADALGAGCDRMHMFVKNGEFDRILLRPRTALLQVAGHELTARRVSRVIQGIVVMGWSMRVLGLGSFADFVLILWAICGGIALFWSLFLMQGTFSFWTTESLEIMNTLTYGGVETAQYPLSIYRRAFRVFFTVVVPLGCVSYFPVITMLGRTGTLPVWIGAVTPTAGFLFLGVCLLFWRFGVRHYTSTGS